MKFHVNYELPPPVQLVTDSFAAIPAAKLRPSPDDSEAEQAFKSKVYYNDYNYRVWEDVNGKNFSSLAEFVPPVKQAGANFTVKFQLPFNNTMWDLEQNYIPFGYGPYYNASYRQPFEEQNVVVLSDGTCASGTYKARSLVRIYMLTGTSLRRVSSPAGPVAHQNDCDRWSAGQ